jgi:hypothetical protein
MSNITLSCIFVCCLWSMANAQQRPFPDGVYVGLRYLEGSDEPVPLKWSRGPIDHVLGKGWGGMLLYSDQLSDRFGWTVESGLWFFEGRKGLTTPSGEQYNERAVLLPLMAGTSMVLLNKGILNVFLNLQAGIYYGQYIIDYEQQGYRVANQISFIYGPTIVVNFNIFRNRSGSRSGFGTHLSFFKIPGRNLRTAGIPLFRILP